MTAQNITDLATHLMGKFNTFVKNHSSIDEFSVFIIPVEKIHDIKVSCYIKIYKKNLWFDIDATDVYCATDEDGHTEQLTMYQLHKYYKNGLKTLKEFEDFVAEVFDALEHLEFNKFTSKFIKHGDLNCNTPVIFEPFLSIPHMKMSYDKCSVCLDNTLQKTRCKHSLCVSCWDKLPRLNNNDRSNKTCPLCRQHIEKDDCEDDDDEDD